MLAVQEPPPQQTELLTVAVSTPILHDTLSPDVYHPETFQTPYTLEDPIHGNVVVWGLPLAAADSGFGEEDLHVEPLAKDPEAGPVPGQASSVCGAEASRLEAPGEVQKRRRQASADSEENRRPARRGSISRDPNVLAGIWGPLEAGGIITAPPQMVYIPDDDNNPEDNNNPDDDNNPDDENGIDLNEYIAWSSTRNSSQSSLSAR